MNAMSSSYDWMRQRRKRRAACRSSLQPAYLGRKSIAAQTSPRLAIDFVIIGRHRQLRVQASPQNATGTGVCTLCQCCVITPESRDVVRDARAGDQRIAQRDRLAALQHARRRQAAHGEVRVDDGHRQRGRVVGLVGLAGTLPGQLRAIELDGSLGWFAEREAFICAEEGVAFNIAFSKLGVGLRSGEGFILEHFTGQGTLVVAGGEVFVQAGAGVVADSKPEREFEETPKPRS